MRTNGQRTISLSRLRAMRARVPEDGRLAIRNEVDLRRTTAGLEPAQALRTIGSTRATAGTMASEGNFENGSERGVPHALLRIGVPRSTSAANGAVKTAAGTLRFTGAREDVRAVTCFNWGNAELLLTNMMANVVLLGLHPATATLQSTVYSTSADQPRRVHGTVL